jgi:hypothetical protein
MYVRGRISRMNNIKEEKGLIGTSLSKYLSTKFTQIKITYCLKALNYGVAALLRLYLKGEAHDNIDKV